MENSLQNAAKVSPGIRSWAYCLKALKNASYLSCGKNAGKQSVKNKRNYL